MKRLACLLSFLFVLGLAVGCDSKTKTPTKTFTPPPKPEIPKDSPEEKDEKAPPDKPK